MESLITIKNLHKHFESKKGFWGNQKEIVYALNGISLEINKGETYALVGESGCGKSTAGRCIIGLDKATKGEVFFEGTDITKANKKTLKNLRQKIQIIFQNPYASLNPRMTIGDILREPLKINTNLNKAEIEQEVYKLLDMVGMSKDSLTRYAHEFSGGQRQRVGIARALALKPQFIVADEPTSALDVSIQAQIINLMQKLKKELNLTYLVISHDLSLVRHIADKVGVMYLGEIVEEAPCKELFDNPKHPYTKALLSAAPSFDTTKGEKILLSGDLPSPKNLPIGCNFCTRCPNVMNICKENDPEYTYFSTTHKAKCHLYSKEPTTSQKL